LLSIHCVLFSLTARSSVDVAWEGSCTTSCNKVLPAVVVVVVVGEGGEETERQRDRDRDRQRDRETEKEWGGSRGDHGEETMGRSP
jgi:hypothetical protein